MKSVALVLAHASQDDVNSPVSPRDSRTPLHLAASLGNLAMAQLLIWVSYFVITLLVLDHLIHFAVEPIYLAKLNYVLVAGYVVLA